MRVAWLALLLVGCPGENPFADSECLADSDCPAGQMCVEETCAPVTVDGGGEGDASSDARVEDMSPDLRDAAPLPPDATPQDAAPDRSVDAAPDEGRSVDEGLPADAAREDSAVADAEPVEDAAPDSVSPDAASPPPDAALDPDAEPDAAPDAALDPDAERDAAPEPDMRLPPVDAAPDVELDAAPDVQIDANLDAAADAAGDARPDAEPDLAADQGIPDLGPDPICVPPTGGFRFFGFAEDALGWNQPGPSFWRWGRRRYRDVPVGVVHAVAPPGEPTLLDSHSCHLPPSQVNLRVQRAAGSVFQVHIIGAVEHFTLRLDDEESVLSLGEQSHTRAATEAEQWYRVSIRVKEDNQDELFIALGDEDGDNQNLFLPRAELEPFTVRVELLEGEAWVDWISIAPRGQGVPEICDGTDNDNDDQVDEDIEATLGDECAGPHPSGCVVRDGNIGCDPDGDGLATWCNPPHRFLCCINNELRCDGFDEDCDDEVDEHHLGTPDDCAACGDVCPERDNAARTCVDDTCAFDCAPGYGDVDEEVENGCERVAAGECPYCAALLAWPFEGLPEGPIVDASGNDHTGLRNRNPPLAIQGVVGGAARMVVEGDVEGAATADLDPRSFTFETWLRVPDLNDRILVNRSNGAQTRLQLGIEGGELVGRFDNQGGGDNGLVSFPGLQVDVWYHVALRWELFWELYVDGERVPETGRHITGGEPAFIAAPLQIFGPADFDEVVLWPLGLPAEVIAERAEAGACAAKGCSVEPGEGREPELAPLLRP